MHERDGGTRLASCRTSSGAGHGVDTPVARSALGRFAAGGAERDRRPEHDIADGLRDEDFAAAGEVGDSTGDLDGDPTDFVTGDLALTAVQAGPGLVPGCAQLVNDRGCAANRPSGTVEGRHEPLLRAVHGSAAEPMQELTGLALAR